MVKIQTKPNQTLPGSEGAEQVWPLWFLDGTRPRGSPWEQLQPSAKHFPEQILAQGAAVGWHSLGRSSLLPIGCCWQLSWHFTWNFTWNATHRALGGVRAEAAWAGQPRSQESTPHLHLCLIRRTELKYVPDSSDLRSECREVPWIPGVPGAFPGARHPAGFILGRAHPEGLDTAPLHPRLLQPRSAAPF